MVNEESSKISDADFLQAFHKGKEHFDNNRLNEARIYLEKAYKMKPTDEKVLNLLGMVYFKLNYLNEAEEIYEKLIASNSNIYVLHSNLGLIRLKLGKIHDAEISLKKALDLQPHNPKAQVYMGLLYEKANDYPKALYYFEKGGAQKLVEQLQEKMAAMPKEEPIEEAEILEVINKKPPVVEQKAPAEDINIFAKEATEEQEEPVSSEKKADELYKYFVPEIKETPPLDEEASEQKPQEYSVSKMAHDLGLEVSQPLIDTEEESSSEESLEEEVTVLEETSAAEISKPTEEKETISTTIKSDEVVSKVRGMASELGVEFEPAPKMKEPQEIQPPAEKTSVEITSEVKEKSEESSIITETISPPAKKALEETAEIRRPKIIPSVKKEEASPEPVTVTTVEQIPKKESIAEQPVKIPIPDIISMKPLSLDFFSRDRFYIQPLTGADRFLLVDPHLLEIVLSEEILIRKGTMSSFSGEIKFDFIKFDEMDTPLIKCQGAGVIFLSHERREIFLFSLNNEEVNIEESHFLVAQGSLKITGNSLAGNITYLNIKGTGTLGISIKSYPLTLNVLASMPVNIYSDALIAWSGNLNVLKIQEEDIKGIMTCYEENAIPLKFKGIGDVVVEQGSLWGDRRTKL